MTTIALLLVSLYFWAGELEYGGLGEAWRKAGWINWSLGHLADILHYFLPDFFQNIINYGILKQPWWGAGFFGTVVLYYVLRSRFRRWSDAACEKARYWVMGKAR